MPVQFNQKVGWRTEDYLVIGQIVPTDTYDGSNPTTSGDGGGDEADFINAIAYDISDNFSKAGFSLVSLGLPYGSETTIGNIVNLALKSGSLSDAALGFIEFPFWASVKHIDTPQGPFQKSYPANLGEITSTERFWMLQNGLNFSVDDSSGAPTTITPTTLTNILEGKQFRIFHHYQTRFSLNAAGKIDTSTLHDIQNDAVLGPTKLNIQIPLDISVTVAGIPFTIATQIGPITIPAQPSPSNGSLQTSLDGTQHSSYASGRVGFEAQNPNWRIFGRDVPWIFSEIIAEVAPDHTVTSHIEMSVNKDWQDDGTSSGKLSGTINFNNLNIYKATINPNNGSISYVQKRLLPMEGQLKPFINSVPLGTWPEPTHDP